MEIMWEDTLRTMIIAKLVAIAMSIGTFIACNIEGDYTAFVLALMLAVPIIFANGDIFEDHWA